MKNRTLTRALGLLAAIGLATALSAQAAPPIVNDGVDSKSNGLSTVDSSVDTTGLNISAAPTQAITQQDALVFCAFFIPNYYDLYMGKNTGLPKLVTVADPEVLHAIDKINRTLPRTTVRQAKVLGITPKSWHTVDGKPGIAVFQIDGLVGTGVTGSPDAATKTLVRWTIILARVNQISPDKPDDIGLTWVETPKGRKGYPNNMCGLLLLKADLTPNK